MDPVAESALAGSAVLRFRPAASAGQTPVTAPPSDVDRVLARIRTLLLAEATAASVDTAIASILRDGQFAAAWNNANAIIRGQTSTDEMLAPIVVDSLRSTIGGYRDELQTVATAWAEVVGGMFQKLRAGKPPRPEIADIDPRRFLLPSYLDDDRLPIEVWEALRSRDAAAVSYIALVCGAEAGASAVLLPEYAERHCRHQRRWLDLLAWMFDLPRPAILPDRERVDWTRVFAETAEAQRGIDALFEHASAHPAGFAVGDISTDRE